MNVGSFDELIGKQSAIHLEKSTQKKVLRIMNEMENEWNAYNKYSEIILKGLLHKLILIYMKSHLNESPSLPDTAEHIHVSASYLSKVFINQLHTPYSTFILNEKILYAQK